MSSIVPITPGIEDRRADARRIRIDEADDLDAELVPPLEQLARQRDGRRAGADEQQPLARADLPAQPLEGHAPADHAEHDQEGGES